MASFSTGSCGKGPLMKTILAIVGFIVVAVILAVCPVGDGNLGT